MKLPKTSLGPWQWAICLLLLLATMINYMDRQVLANMAVQIKSELQLNHTQYGNVEWAFGTAFAFGSLFFGFLVDVVSVRWLYPVVLVAWSMVGFATGFVRDYDSLLVCRTLLGVFEAGHWPCALVVVQSILANEDRSFGNSILQSGASIGAILVPWIITLWFLCFGEQAWRGPFQLVGVIGIFWAIAWFVTAKPQLLIRVKGSTSGQNQFAWQTSSKFLRRFVALAIMVVSINTTWQIIRAWLNMFLETGRGYSPFAARVFNSAYYLATDVGCILSGAAVMFMSRHGIKLHFARLVTFAFCAALSCLTWLASSLGQGPLLLMVLLCIGAGTLGLFPCYYSWNQELAGANLGKVSGILSFTGWIASSPMQSLFGSYVDRTGSYDAGLALVGLCPLIGLAAMLILWPKSDAHEHPLR